MCEVGPICFETEDWRVQGKNGPALSWDISIQSLQKHMMHVYFCQAPVLLLAQMRKFVTGFIDGIAQYSNVWVTVNTVFSHKFSCQPIYYLILLHIILCLDWITNPFKQPSITDFATFAKNGLFDLALWRHHSSICDVTRTRGTGIVMSYLSIVLAHTHWHEGDHH